MSIASPFAEMRPLAPDEVTLVAGGLSLPVRPITSPLEDERRQLVEQMKKMNRALPGSPFPL